MKPGKLKYWLPAGLFVILAAVLAVGLTLDPRRVPSPLIDKAAPSFQLARLWEPDKQFSTEDMRGEVWVLNVWASWCVGCREEHEVLARRRGPRADRGSELQGQARERQAVAE